MKINQHRCEMIQQSKHYMTEMHLRFTKSIYWWWKRNGNYEYRMNTECSEHWALASCIVICYSNFIETSDNADDHSKMTNYVCVVCARTSTIRYRNILIFANRRCTTSSLWRLTVLLHTIIGTILVQCIYNVQPQVKCRDFESGFFFWSIRTCCQLIWTIFHYDMMYGVRMHVYV